VTASTNAIRLAAFCSVLHRIPLEIFDLLQTEFVPEAGPDDVTEFVLSGLVELRADGQGGPWYMFRPGVPGVLSTRLPVADAWRLYSRLIDHLAVASGDPDLAEAVLYEVGRDVDVPAAARPYAFASQNLLRALGWQQPATAPQPEATGPQQAAGDPAAVDPAGGSRVSERDPQVPVARLDVLAGERTSDRVTHSDSVLYRRRLSNELRKIREAAGMSQRDVAAAMDWSQSKLLRIETGVVNISISDLRALLSHYGANQNKIATMLDLARSAREVPGWSLYRDVAAPEHVAFLGYESSASVIRSFEPTLVPALLQTEEYAREALGALEATDPQHIDALIDLRMQRQELLTIENPPQLHFILDESVIWRRVGGHAVMRRQLELLLEWSARPNVTIRIVPFSQGVYSKMNVPYVYFEFPAPEDDGLLYIEYPLGNRIINEYPGADTDRLATAYAATFWRLEQLASSEVFRRRVEHQIAQYPASFGTDANTRSRA
jgi:transcriptional regulator with XRE-family HTH domain